jgi:hypothetical protein
MPKHASHSAGDLVRPRNRDLAAVGLSHRQVAHVLFSGRNMRAHLALCLKRPQALTTWTAGGNLKDKRGRHPVGECYMTDAAASGAAALCASRPLSDKSLSCHYRKMQLTRPVLTPLRDRHAVLRCSCFLASGAISVRSRACRLAGRLAQYLLGRRRLRDRNRVAPSTLRFSRLADVREA